MRILAFALCFVAINAYPSPNADSNKDVSNERQTCRLVSLLPQNLELPPINLDEFDLESIAIDDPLTIENSTITLNEHILKGTYTFVNGLVEGLSTLKFDFESDKGIRANISLDHVTLTGHYEIVDGQANLTTLGEHTFSGSGPLTASLSGMLANFAFSIDMDPSTQFISVANLTIDVSFKNASIVATNLVVDDKLVDWTEVNQTIGEIYRRIWVEAHDANVQLIQQKINWLLQGCTLMNLLELAKPPQPQQ